jgi:glycyl-tRNA synthetase
MAESEAIIELAKRRGFFFPAAESYGGVAGFYTFGPEGATLKKNVETAWRDRFTVREGNHEIEAPTVLPEPVFEASGHLETFNDMLVECAECGTSHRADHIVEDATDIEDAEAMSLEAVGELIADHDLHCPNCNAPLAGQEVTDFNLMFATSIGPGSGQPGYLRPETAQGIFPEFPRLKEYARNKLPFGVTQIGKAYRNEISPRRGIIRVRELTQAELEQFVDPEDDEPPLHRVEDVAVTLYSAEAQQTDDGGYLETTIGEAVEEQIIASPWVGYYLGVAQQWYERIGVDMERFRFRQHLAGERAHYAADCWDAEGEIGTGDGETDWIEMAGFAYRSDYDLSKHAEATEDDFTIFKQYDEPKTVERATVDPDMAVLGPEFGGDAGAVKEALETLAERDPDAFEADEVTVEVDGESYTVESDVANFSVEEVTEAGEHVLPHVVEPSFGVDRTVYVLLDHGYETDEVSGEARNFLSLAPEMAPTDVAVFPLVSNHQPLLDTSDEVVQMLREAGFDVRYDDSGSIGRRYRRQDEVGTPFCVTVDRDGLEGEGEDTVTVRDRDTGAQARVPVGDLAGQLEALRTGDTEFTAVQDRYEAVATDLDGDGAAAE